MIARLTVATPFVMVIPEGASYAGYTYHDEGYAIMARPPAKSDIPLPHDIPNNLKSMVRLRLLRTLSSSISENQNSTVGRLGELMIPRSS
jgi:hypothetical protein